MRGLVRRLKSARSGSRCWAHICVKVTEQRTLALALLLAGVGALTGVAATGKTAAFPLDLVEGDRVSAGSEELTFSNLWDGDVEATVTIAQDGAAIYEGLTGEGEKTWSVDRNGRYELTHTTYTNGAPSKVETAVFVVEGKKVPVRELTVEWESSSYKYDSNGKTPSVTAKDGETPLVKGVDYTVDYEGNTNAGTAKAILTGLPPYVGSVTNEFTIAKRVVGLTSGSASKSYDGTPLVCHSVTTNGDGFVSGEGVDFTFSGSQTTVGTSKNAFDYTFKTGTLAGNYTITKTEGDLTVTSGEIVNPFDPDDPSKPVTPEVLAKVDCITNYDGDGHSIEVAAFLNPLIAANNPKIAYSLLRDGTYEARNPSFTNVVSTSVWYRIEADNFNMFTTNALLKILPRSIMNVDLAAIGDQTYTGSGIEPIPEVTDMRTLIGMSEPTDILTSADYDLSYLNNTNVGKAKIVVSGKNNYEGSQTNTFQIVPAIIPPGPTGAIVATGYTNAYDGAAHGVSVTASGLKTTPTIQYKSSPSAEWQGDSPTYTDVCDTQVWWKVSAPNYQSVVGTIGLKITQAENVWTTEPAIRGWTYGETAKTPVGAAKFGEVTFAYSPMPVGAAGDYTMTATVAGTANYTGLSRTVPLTISKATLPGGGEEPGGGTMPEGGLSKFDMIAMYDGEGHTIATNDLIAAFKAAVGGDVAVAYACGGPGGPALPWMAVAPDFINVCATSVWYRVTSANYQDFTHEAKVTVTNRPVTLTSGTESFDYDGNAHSNMTVTVIGEGFVTGEGVTTNNFATIMEKGSKPNAFDYELILNPGSVAENYRVTCVTGTLTVASVANAWLVEPMVTGKAYDGMPAAVTMGTPRFGTVSVTYDGGQTAVPVGAGDHTAKFVVAATADYGALEKVVNYTITKAAFPGGGEEPGGGEKPEGGVSKFDTVAMYDGEGHTIKTDEMRIAFSPYTGGEDAASPFRFAASSSGPWGELPTVVTNVGTTSVWYKFTSANYEDFVHEAKVTVTPRDISNVTVENIPDQQHTGAAIKPTVIVTDGDPTIVTVDDYTVAYSDNISIGTATVTLTGKGNYTGTKAVHFKIVGSSAAVLKAEIGWKLLAASGTFMAQLKVTCTSGLATGISDLRFMFADRVIGDVTTAALWDTPNRAVKSTTMTYGGGTYRYVALDASRIMTENAPTTYGVRNLAASSIPLAERTIELYVRTRVDPSTDEDSYIGYISWVSGDETFCTPVPVGGISTFLTLLSDVNDCGLTGGGVVKRPAVNKSTGYLKERANASWSATPDAGSVFGGWSAVSDAPECVAGHLAAFSANELKNKKLTFKVGAGEQISPMHVAAAWARIDEDKIRRVALTTYGLEVGCKSSVSATVSGLPKGVKFDAKTLAVSGVLKAKDAVYMVKVSVKNASGYTWKGCFPMTVDGGVVTDIAPAVDVMATGTPVMVGCDGALGKTTGTKVYVAGKKASIRATPAKGSIFLGWYKDAAFVTPATGLPKGYLTASQSVVVPTEGLDLHARFVKMEDWAVGTFDGIFYDVKSSACGTVTLTISSKGKVSGKIQSGGKVYAFNAAAFDDARMIDGELAFVTHPTVKVDGEVRTLVLFVTEGEIRGLGSVVIFCGDETDAPFARAVQNGWKMKPVALPEFSTRKDARTSIVADGLTLTFAAKGAVRLSGKVDGKRVVATTQVLPVAWRSDMNRDMLAQVGVYIPPKSGFGGLCKVYDVSLTVGTDGKFESVR